MTLGADLNRLQTLDREADAKRQRLREVEAGLGESGALRQARQAVQKAEGIVRKWMLRQRDLELNIQGLSEKISHSEERLYSGAIRNPKELADLQAEVRSLRRRRQKLEDDLLEAMIECERAETVNAQAQERLERVQNQWTAGQADLMAEREELQVKLEEIEQARTALLSNIEASDLAAYESLRRRKGGLAVVQVRDGACGACGMAVSPSLEWKLREGELVHCSNCERIIVRV